MAQRPQNFRINRNAPLAKGLVFAGFGGYRCPGTSLFADSSLFGNHGTLTNMDPATDWVWASELGRWVLDLDGVNDYVNVAHSGSLSPSDGLTITAWVYATKTAFVGVLSKTPLGNNFGDYALNMRASDGTLRFTLNNANGDLNVATAGVTANAWKHVAATYDKSLMRLYVNGVQLATARAYTTAIAQNAVDFRVGLYYSAGLHEFGGRMGDPVAYNRALSTAEIQQLADPSNAMLSGLILPPKRRLWPVVSASPTNPIVIELPTIQIAI